MSFTVVSNAARPQASVSPELYLARHGVTPVVTYPRARFSNRIKFAPTYTQREPSSTPVNPPRQPGLNPVTPDTVIADLLYGNSDYWLIAQSAGSTYDFGLIDTPAHSTLDYGYIV